MNGSVGYCAADCLQDERKEVGGHKADGDGPRGEAGIVRAVEDNDACDAEVNCGCDEDGSDCDRNEVAVCHVRHSRIFMCVLLRSLHQERVVVEWLVVQLYPRCIANDLQC